jgi:hypothetical protein
VLLIPCVFGLSACTTGNDADAAAARAIVDEVNEGAKRIDLGHLVAGQWERVAIAGAFATPDEVNDLAGFELPRRISGQVEMTEDHQLLVFLRESEVVSWTTLSRYSPQGAEFDAVADRVYDRDSARFDVRRDEEGAAHLVPPGAP